MRQIHRAVFSKVLLFVGALLILIQQFPNYKENHYEQLRTYIYVVFGLLAVISIFKVFIQKKRAHLINIYAALIVAVGIEFVILYFLKRSVHFGDLLEIVVPFGLVVSSYAIDLEKRGLEILAKAYALAILVVSMVQIFYYAGGFFLYEQYIVSDKNIIGSFVAAAAGVAFYYALIYVDAGRKLSSIVWIMVFGLLMSVLVTVRSRAALISVLVVMVLMTIKSRKILRKLLIAVTLIAAVSLLSSGLLQIALNSVRESVVMGYEFTDVDSLSGGRFGVYSEAIDIVKEYPFFGEISARDQSPRIPHNYLLNKAKRYGLLGGSLFIVFYGFMVVYIYKNIQAAKGMTFWGLPIFLLLIPFLISFLEYQHPYGPGTSQAFVYFMLGQYVLADFKTQLCGARKNGGLMRDNGERAADRQIRVPRRVAVSKGL